MSQNRVFIGFGSNVGDREKNVARAVASVAELEGTALVARASLYESPAMLTDDAPQDWNMPFINTVAAYDTGLEPLVLLRNLQIIEQEMGKRVRGYWGPREIDIDILAYNRQILKDPALSVPHPEAHLRDFVLLPWAEIAPDWRHPISGMTIAEYVAFLESTTCKPYPLLAA